jgi:flagellar basal body-associated protein FliL
MLIDTEGLGSLEEDANHDAKIFAIALLISSLLIYNQVGSIDDEAV